MKVDEEDAGLSELKILNSYLFSSYFPSQILYLAVLAILYKPPDTPTHKSASDGD